MKPGPVLRPMLRLAAQATPQGPVLQCLLQALALVGLCALLVLAGCGGGEPDEDPPPPPRPPLDCKARPELCR